jgi:hypothetical protein
MLKLFLLLAFVAIVASEPSSALDFQDLDDVEDDSLLADLSGLDDEPSSCKPDAGTCPNGMFRMNYDDWKCEKCPSATPATPYGQNLVNCGVASCFSCPLHTHFFDFYKICVTPQQEQQLMNSSFQSAVQDVEENSSEDDDLSMNGCESGKTCCLPGYYGDSSSKCTLCPQHVPSSPFSRPDSNCKCSNAEIRSCFACTDACKPYNPLSKMCTPKPCSQGKSCKVISKIPTCV